MWPYGRIIAAAHYILPTSMDNKSLLGASNWRYAANCNRGLVFEDAVTDGFAQDGVAWNHIRTECGEVIKHA